MRILFVCCVSLLMCSMVGCGGGDDNTSEVGSSLSITGEQYKRNQDILQVALDDYSDNVGLSCKEWIRDVIKRATNGEVVIPSNTSEGDGWEPDSNGYTFGGGDVILSHQNTDTPFLNILPGAIVQMQWKPNVGSSDSAYNMHTAIVFSVFPNGVIFIESNYDSTPKDDSDAVVGIRFVSEEEFIEDVQAYSVYYIQ